MNPTSIELVGAIIFATAILHTFSVSFFQKFAHRFALGSIGENIFHFLGEVEAVFGLWSLIFLIFYSSMMGNHEAVAYLESRNFTEPMFVFVVMCVAATRPLISLAETLIYRLSSLLPMHKRMAFFFSTLVFGPLMGSFITEPGAMTLSALILLENFFTKGMSPRFKYATIGALFVNVSIGGTLTHFAAPPVLMVAAKWNLDMPYMLGHIGWKAFVSCVITALATTFVFREELRGKVKESQQGQAQLKAPAWVVCMHLMFLGLIVFYSHHMVVFIGIFLFFMGFATITKEFQDTLALQSSLMVGFFLAGLVVLGGMQSWWLQPLISRMSNLALYFGATALTAITDNAALTYLGSLVEGLSDSAKYNLLAGSVTGGGLTVIANAPNPAGYGILKDSFGEDGIAPLGLFLGALLPTVIAILCFQLLPDFL